MRKTIAAIIFFLVSLFLFGDASQAADFPAELSASCKEGVCLPAADFSENCKDGICELPAEIAAMYGLSGGSQAADFSIARKSVGYLTPRELEAFLRGEKSAADAQAAGKFYLFFIFLGGILLNLTPCVLPMIPVQLAIIGKSPRRGAIYGLGIALTFGALGLVAALTGSFFGAIQSHWIFNTAIAIVMLFLTLVMLDVVTLPAAGIISTGAISALLAGACTAPVIFATLLLAADGKWFAPFALGLGMGAPWPFLAAGIKFLPKPGKWMLAVKALFALCTLALAVYYAALACGKSPRLAQNDSAAPIVNAGDYEAWTNTLAHAQSPILVDVFASWCKNCSALERNLQRSAAAADFFIIRLAAENPTEEAAEKMLGELGVSALPTLLVIER